MQILLVSPRNSLQGQQSLLEKTRCSKFLFSEEMQDLAQTLKDQNHSLNIVQVPDLTEAIDTHTSVDPYPGNFSEDENEPVMVLHTSGSTGLVPV